MLYPITQEEKDAVVAEHKRLSKQSLVEKMRMLYGSHFPDHCGDCKQFYCPGGTSNTYYKCRLAGVTSGPKTDWRVKWDACGKFEKREVGVPV